MAKGFIFWFLLFECAMLIVVVSVFIIIMPAYYSTNNECIGDINNCSDKARNNIAGYYNIAKDEIVILVENGTLKYRRIYTHELCHRTQKDEGRLNPLSDKKGRFKNELECSIKEWAFWKW